MEGSPEKTAPRRRATPVTVEPLTLEAVLDKARAAIGLEAGRSPPEV